MITDFPDDDGEPFDDMLFFSFSDRAIPYEDMSDVPAWPDRYSRTETESVDSILVEFTDEAQPPPST